MAGVNAPAIEFISKDEIKKLGQEFATGRAPRSDEMKGFIGQKLLCDMFGARTRLQVERGVNLYDFDSNLKNRGAQVIEVYGLKESGIKGEKDRLVDEIRWVGQNQILAQLAMRRAGDSPGFTVLAYSRCRLTGSL